MWSKLYPSVSQGKYNGLSTEISSDGGNEFEMFHSPECGSNSGDGVRFHDVSSELFECGLGETFKCMMCFGKAKAYRIEKDGEGVLNPVGFGKIYWYKKALTLP